MTQDSSKAYLHFFQGIGIGASGAMLNHYVAFAAVIISLIAFIWSCLDAQDDKKDDDEKTAEKATQAPELFTKYQKILNEEDEIKLRESFSFSAKDIAKFNRLFQPEKYPYPQDSEFSEEQEDVVPVHIKKAWNPYKKRQSLCPAGTSREYSPLRRSSVPVPPFIVVSSPSKEKRSQMLNAKESTRPPSPSSLSEKVEEEVKSKRKKDVVLTMMKPESPNELPVVDELGRRAGFDMANMSRRHIYCSSCGICQE